MSRRLPALRTSSFNEAPPRLFLLLLVAVDVVFVLVHSSALLGARPGDMFRLDTEGGYPEMYQAIKFLCIVGLLLFLAKVSARGYATWALLFAYLLADDALQIHETFGFAISEHLAFTPPLNLRLQDMGELIVSATAGTVLLAAIGWAYVRSADAFRKTTLDLLLLLTALVFFGVIVDLAHVAVDFSYKFNFGIGVVEDGGEMVVVSFVLYYVFLVSALRGAPRSYLHETLRHTRCKAHVRRAHRMQP